MTINEVQDEIIAEFEVFDEWLDKYEYLIELKGKSSFRPTAMPSSPKGSSRC